MSVLPSEIKTAKSRIASSDPLSPRAREMLAFIIAEESPKQAFERLIVDKYEYLTRRGKR